ncbi:MAG: HAMP domain-containing methyl-accepting chemotaxis protein [Nitrospirota bacterium]|nr:HAMP domain-containing methyl-accepting chemotaxis protein [Nitrospirota bacterium]
MIFRKSITAKFIVTLFILLLIGQTLGALMFLLHSKSVFYECLQMRIDTEATLLAGISSGPLKNGDYSSVLISMQELMKDMDIVGIEILDDRGNVVAEKTRKMDTGSNTVNLFLFEGTMTLKKNVVFAGGAIGEVIIRYTTASMNKNILKSIKMMPFYHGVMFLSVGVAFVFLFGRNIRKPVMEINSSIEKITKGDLTAEVPDLGENEIGGVARGINFLAERLTSIISNLNATAVNVSMAVKQVDLMYGNVIDGIKKQSDAVRQIIKSIQDANESQSGIIVNTEELSSFSTENVSSLLQMKATAEEIVSNIQRLYRATEDSYSVIVDLTQAAAVISKNSKEVVYAVETTFVSIEEVGMSIKEVEARAKDSSRLAEEVKDITSDTGMLAVVDAVEGIGKISGEVKKSTDIIQRLGTRSKDIEKVLSVIKDVTEQTNLLSLNAAILAAQAGEYGKSFSVVADEIGALSERTTSSTREIAGIVKNIQNDIKDAVRSIDSAKVKVDEGGGLVLRVGDALKSTLAASERSAEMTKAIERATEEQSVALKQITASIEDIRTMMNNVAESTGEQEYLISHLLEAAGEVKEVADISKRGTEEQAIGTRIISKNFELTNDRVTRINSASMQQKRLNDEIVVSMQQINSLGDATIKDMEEVSQSLNTLFGEIEILKKDMEVFKIG